VIKPRPPHKSARECRRLAKAVNSVGIDFGAAAIGVDHDLIQPISAGIARLSAALQEMGEDLERRALTPPPAPEPAPRPTPILDLCGVLESASPDDEKKAFFSGEAPDEKKACDEPPLPQVDATVDTYAAFAGRNPQFTLEACDEAEATRIVARVFPDRGFRFQAVTPQWAAERKLPCFQHWKEATIKGLQASMSPGQLCDGFGVPQVKADGSPLKACDLHRADEAHPKVPAPHADDSPPTRPDDAMSGPPEPAPGPADPEVRAYPTESPRDPLATLPVEELGLRKPVLELVRSKGITLAGQLLDEMDVEPLESLLTQEQEDEIRNCVDAWENCRAADLEQSGAWLDEELTYAAFRVGDAAEFWARMRESGASDPELRDAINKRFFAFGGSDCEYRVGYHFQPGPAPAFFMGAIKPKRYAEPALEGKPLLDRVRALLAIPTREAPAKGKAAARPRKAVKA